MKKLLFAYFAFITSISTAQEKATINVTTEGKLSQLLTSEGYNTNLVKDLTLTGSLDVRDFKFMRDSMPVLAILDMENVQIKAYNGTLKNSHFNESNRYLANEIPFGAFCYPNFGGKLTLINIKLPKSITSIAQWAFGGCTNLSGPLNLPSSIKNIGSGAYESCSGLTGNLIIPESVETIRFSAFVGCDKLIGTINIPASVKLIEDAPFTACPGITEITVSEENPYFISDNGILYNKDKTILIQCPAGKVANTLTIPYKIETIGISAFNNCKEISGDLIIPNSVKILQGSAFQNCSGFNGKLVLSNSLSNIYPFSFSQCSGLKGDIIIPYGIKRIYYFAFYNCKGFDGKLILPSTVDTLEEKAFYNCSGLKSIQVMKTNPVIIFDSTFAKVDKVNCELIVPVGSKPKYQTALYWKEFTNIKESPLITFNSQGGTVVAPLMADIDSKITEPEAPTKPGYTFIGWYKESDCTNEWNFSADIANGNIVLYAKWSNSTEVNNIYMREIKLYPNPAKDFVTIYEKAIKQISIYDISGMPVKYERVASNNYPVINIQSLKPGLYLLETILSDGKPRVFKMNKK